MGYPLIIYKKDLLLNGSFENNTGSSPASWTETQGSCGVSTAYYFDRGSNEGSQSADCQTTDAFAVGLLVQAMTYAATDSTIAAVGMARVANAASGTMGLRISTGVAGAVDQSVTATTTWQAVYNEANNTGTNVTVSIFGGDTNIVNYLWDYITVGRPVNFTRQEFSEIQVVTEYRTALNQAAGAYESVVLADPFVSVSAQILRVERDSVLETQLNDFLGYCGRDKAFAFWLDRSDSTNEGLHFQDCILVGAERYRETARANGYSYRLDFICPKEWRVQDG